MDVIKLKEQIDIELSKVATPKAKIVVPDVVSFRLAEEKLTELGSLLANSTPKGWKPTSLCYDGSWLDDKPKNINIVAKFKRI